MVPYSYIAIVSRGPHDFGTAPKLASGSDALCAKPGHDDSQCSGPPRGGRDIELPQQVGSLM